MLALQPHPEGGHYGETYRAAGGDSHRASLTAIYYLLQVDEISAWHQVDADEAWLWHAGGPLALTLSPPDGKGASGVILGPDLRAGQRPQAIVPAGHWQTAETLGAWTLVSCLVAPGFEFSGFTMAPPGWRPEV
ncbi:cupin domain-containing protein [Hyphomonas sp.]|uniref:cupin domain-containing protein n=1 Tax=Hyphomonas sp. TaxID=87 RepID=UPI002639FCF6|nr:cupin domain-containing protein [Hyphomonas sp.]